METSKKVQNKEADKVIVDNLKTMSDDELLTLLDKVNMDAIIEKSAKNRSIWNDKAKAEFGKTEKSARRKLRTLQLSLSKSVLRFAKLKDKQGTKGASLNLQKFYDSYLVSFDVYSNVSIETNPEKHNIINTAYKVMQVNIK